MPVYINFLYLECVFFSPTDEYLKVRQKCRQAEEASNLETEAESQDYTLPSSARGKRKRK